MMNRVGNAHAWAALLLLAAACDGGGGGGGDDEDSGRRDGSVVADAEVDGEVDGEMPEEDGGAPGEDAEVDAGSEEDAGDVADGSMDADTPDTGADTGSGGGDEAGSDAGTDAGPPLPANCAESAITAGTGGAVTSTDSRFTLTLAAGQLSADATVRVCVVAAASAPQAAIDDGRVGDVFEITATNSATITGATATFSGHSSFPGPDSTAQFTPVRVRTIVSGGSAASGGNSVLAFHKATSGSTATLTATVAGPGLVYAAPLEAAYQVEIASPKLAYVTGEIIDLSPIVSVAASPTPAVATRTLEAELQGCDLEPINNATPNHVINQVSGTRAGCSHFTTVARADQAAPTTPQFPNGIEGSTVLASGATVNLRDAGNNPPSLYCRRPGTGWGATRLYFKNGSATDLTIEKRLDVSCTFSGDWIEIYDQVDITRSGSGGFVVGTTYTPRSYVSIAPPSITYTALAPDAVRYAEPAAVLSGSAATATFAGVADIESGMDPPGVVHTLTNSVTFTYGTDRYAAALTTPTPGFFGLQARAHLHIRQSVSGSTLFDCYPASASDLALQTGPRAGASSTVSTLDGTIDVISIRARFPGTGGATIVQRWVDATRLTSQQAVPLLTADQQTALASLGAASEYAVGLYRVAWDEGRRLWDGGRVLPVACGTVLLFEAADVTP